MPKNKSKDYFLSVELLKEGIVLKNVILKYIIFGKVCIGGGFCPIGEKRLC